MSLRFLLDENLSQTVAEQVSRHRAGIVAESVHTWHEGKFEGSPDQTLLQAARAEGLTLVTYDQRTIPDLLTEMFAAGLSHAGIIFVDYLTIAPDDFGTLTRALILFWERHQALDWQNRVSFLDKPKRA